MPVTKATLADSVFKNSDLQKNESIVIIDSLLEIIKSALESGEDILFSGFGKFTVKEKRPVKEETLKPRNLCNLMPGRWLSSDAPQS
jgi:nucleoid DNA-binding protein